MRTLKVVSALVILVGSLAVSSPASAKIQRSGPLLYVTESALSRSGIVSPNVESICPSGSRAVGAGGAFNRPSANARLSKVLLIDETGTEAQGFNVGGGDRTITSVAICLRAPLSDTASYPSSVSHGNFSSAGANFSCPPSTRLGDSAGISPPASGRRLIDTFPDSPSGYAASFTGPAVADSVFTLRIACVSVGIFTTRTTTRSASVAPGAVRSVKAKCPRRTRVVGGGVDSVGGYSASRPIDSGKDADKTPDDGWSATVPNASDSTQSFTVHAVCARRV